MSQKMKSMALLLCFALTAFVAGAEDKVRDNPRLPELLNMLDLNAPGLKAVRNAGSPAQKQQLLYDYFRNRKMNRLVTPPSRLWEQDKKKADDALEHKFIGQGVYPAQFRGKDRIDWDSNPVADAEWLWQFHRFGWWDSLGRAYMATGDERYAKEWVFELNSWIDHMHNPKVFEKHPGWRQLETGGRLGVFSRMPEYFRKSPSFTSYELVNVLWTLNQHYRSVKKRLSGMNNHRMHEWDGMLTFLLQYPEFKGNTDEAKQIFADIEKCQKLLMHPDGVINEFVPSYHNGNVAQFLAFRKRAEKYDTGYQFSQAYEQIIQNGITAVMLWSHPDGTIPQFGDAWSGKPGSCQSFVGRFLKDYKRPDWEYFASNGKRGTAPKETVHVLEPSGYAMMRSAWKPNALFLVTKNSAPVQFFAHNHHDNLSFELSAYGEPLMIDSGSFSYFGTPEWRGWFRQPQAHAVVTLDNEPIQSRGKFVWSGEFPDLKVISQQNTPADNLNHRRTFFMLDNQYILILDELTGSAAGKLQQHFQLLPGEASIDRSRLTARTMKQQGANLLIHTMPNGDAITLEPEEGWISRVYNQRLPRPAFAFIQDKKAGKKQVFLTLIAPLPENRQIWDLKLSFEKDGKPTTEPTDTIRLKLNNLEDYTLTFSPERKQAALRKNFKPITEDHQHSAFYSPERARQGKK